MSCLLDASVTLLFTIASLQTEYFNNKIADVEKVKNNLLCVFEMASHNGICSDTGNRYL